MANQYPSVLPTGYAGDSTDFHRVKRDTFGAVRMQYASVTVADNSTAGRTFGLVPFRKGFRLSYGSRGGTTDLDTASNVTWNIGYLYESTAFTSDPDAFASAISGQAAGTITFDEKAGLSWVAEGDGWIVGTLAAGPVTTAGTLDMLAEGCYDGVAAAN